MKNIKFNDKDYLNVITELIGDFSKIFSTHSINEEEGNIYLELNEFKPYLWKVKTRKERKKIIKRSVSNLCDLLVEKREEYIVEEYPNDAICYGILIKISLSCYYKQQLIKALNGEQFEYAALLRDEIQKLENDRKIFVANDKPINRFV